MRQTDNGVLVEEAEDLLPKDVRPWGEHDAGEKDLGREEEEAD